MIEDELEQPQSGAGGYQAPESVPTSGGFTPRDTDTGDDENDDILQALVNARPAWLDQPQPGAGGYQPPALSGPHTPLQPAFAGNKTDYQAPFPESTDTTVVATTPAAPANIYTFEIFDASDAEGPKISILDGLVFGPNDDGILPQGMGNDDFILNLDGASDSTEVFLDIQVDPNTGDVVLITIDFDDVTPTDTDTDKYVTIGNITLDHSSGTSVITAVENTVCGDYVMPRTLDILDEDGEVFSDITSVQFTTDGDPYIDVGITDDGPGQVSVHINSSANLISLLTQVQNLINNIVNCNF